MNISLIHHDAVWAITILFIVAATVNLIGPAPIRALYKSWHHTDGTRRTVAVMEFIVVAFMVQPETRWAGILIGGAILFFSIVTLLNSGRYAWSLPVMMFLLALVPAAMA